MSYSGSVAPKYIHGILFVAIQIIWLNMYASPWESEVVPE